jgi:hypothetical protein
VPDMTFKEKLHHERSAWVRHILAPGAPDLDGYLADSMPSGHPR